MTWKAKQDSRWFMFDELRQLSDGFDKACFKSWTTCLYQNQNSLTSSLLGVLDKFIHI